MWNALFIATLLISAPAICDDAAEKLKNTFSTVITCTNDGKSQSFVQLSMAEDVEKHLDALSIKDKAFSTKKGMFSALVDEERQILLTMVNVSISMDGPTKLHTITLELGSVKRLIVETATDVWEERDAKGNKKKMTCGLEERAELARELSKI